MFGNVEICRDSYQLILDEPYTFWYGTLLFLAWMSIRKWEPLLSMHKLKFNEAASKFLFLLICGDVFYFLLHVVYLNGFLNSRFNLEKDWSLPES